MEVFARGADGKAGSYEAARTWSIRVSGAPDMGGYRLVKALGLVQTGIGGGGDEQTDASLAGLAARTPVRLTVVDDASATDGQGNALPAAARPERRLYRFEVVGEHLHVVLRGFSSDPTCVWIPRKAGTYTIQVRIRDARSDGYEDVHVIAENVVVS